MLTCAEERDVRVVVEQCELRSPPDVQWKARAETDAERDAQLRWPCGRFAERRRRPVEPPHATGHFAVARKEQVRGACAGNRYLRIHSGSLSTANQFSASA